MSQMIRFIKGGAALLPATAALATATVALGVPAPQAAHAQVPFRVIRPENGATVRETVRIQFARRALEEAGVKYLSISLDGKFREALAVLPAPAADKKIVRTSSIEVTPQVVNVLWNTKAASDTGGNNKEGGSTLGVADGPHSIEIIAQDAAGKRLGMQTLQLNVDNSGGMQIPAGGLALSYRFQVGDRTRYHQVATVEYIGERKAATPGATQQFQGYTSRGFGQGRGGFGGPGGPGSFGPGDEGGFGGPPPGYGGPGGYPGAGGRGGFGGPGGGYGLGAMQTGPFTVPVQTVRANFERTTEDALGGGAYFLRDKVLDGVIIGGNGAAARLEDVYNFKSRYRTVLTSGLVKEYGVANAARPGAYVALAIPNLGGGRRRVGQTWKVQTPVQLEWATLDKPTMVFATNSLEGLEWQNGYQTARIKQTYNGKADIPIYGGAGRMRQANVQLDRTIWFSYKAGKIIRMETDVTVEGPAPATVLSAMVPSAGVGGGMMGGGGFGGPGGDDGGMTFPAAFGGGGGPGGLRGGPGGMMGAPGGMMGGPGGMMGGGGGFGGLQQQQEEQRVPAKFHSHTVVSLIIPGRS
jgi:hypothetical protein